MPHNLWMFLATLGPIGFIRPAPGTWGSLAAMIIGVGIAMLSPKLLEFAFMIICITGIIAAGKYQDSTGKKDASEIVVDEVAGQWIPLFVIPVDDWRWLLAAFILFRFFDIVKPGPVKMAEALPRGIGVMADDIVAGVLAAVCMLAAQWALTGGLF